MRRLTLLILVFVLLLTPLLGGVFWWSYAGMKREEAATLRFFGAALLESMEDELARVVQREEARAVDEYASVLAADRGAGEGELSPLANAPAEPWVVGYFQSNPDGSFQTPHVDLSLDRIALLQAAHDELTRIRERPETTRTAARESLRADGPPRDFFAAAPPARDQEVAQRSAEQSIMERYLRRREPDEERKVLGKAKEETRQITPGQAMNLSSGSKGLAVREPIRGMGEEATETEAGEAANENASADPKDANESTLLEYDLHDEPETPASVLPEMPGGGRQFRVEIAPITSLLLGDDRALVYRRVVADGQVVRQGFLIDLYSFMDHLIIRHYVEQPIAGYTRLALTVADGDGRTLQVYKAGAGQDPGFAPAVDILRVFPRPFSFLSARLSAEEVPAGQGRRVLVGAAWVTAFVLLAGLVAIYLSARKAVELSRRRAGFVSSVTHELKTPLTSIRMYAEMLEQGMARDEASRKRYLGVIGSEAGRLTRLIANVLEFSRLEQRERPLDLKVGTLDDVLDTMEETLRPRLEREGFKLLVDNRLERGFAYDREVMMQVLMNLVENSMKFGGEEPVKRITVTAREHGKRALVTVRDTGPGVEPRALGHIFDDFYRADDSLTRKTKGTGLGLALVKRFVAAMGGTVGARNAEDGGLIVVMDFLASSQQG
ncbi:MAG: sensor histidine kinase [Oceanidesulfovibrio sp.]